MAERREKLKAIRSQEVAFPNDFKPGNLAANLHKAYGEQAGEAFDTQIVKVIKINDTIGWCGLEYTAIGAKGTAVVPD